MKISQDKLINDLINRTHQVLNEAEGFKQFPNDILQWKPSPEKWGVLECLEHLNRYGSFYLPEIEQRLKTAKPATQTFISGWLGNYFALSMLPKEKLNKMNTFKSMNPTGSRLNREVIDDFILQQKKMLSILERSRKFDLKKTKTSISISKWIKLRLGDTLRVVIYHNQRHMVQAQNALMQNPKYKIDIERDIAITA